MAVDVSDLELVELELIQRDAEDLVRSVGGIQRRPDSGAFIFSLTPLLGLVAEESFSYVEERFQIKPALFDRFGREIVKLRAHIKLFDDTDGRRELSGPGNVEARRELLIALLDEARRKMAISFRSKHRGWLAPLLRCFQPDLGIFFSGEHAVTTVDTCLPALGYTLGDLQAMSHLEFDTISIRSREFGVAAYEYLRQLATFLEEMGKPVCLAPADLDDPNLRVSHNDFHGSEVFEHLRAQFPLREKRFLGPAIMALCYINGAIHLLPKILSDNSNLLFRFQFLCAYHARKALEDVLRPEQRIVADLTDDDLRVLDHRGIRNISAHYGLRLNDPAILAAADPLGAAIEHHARRSREEVSVLVRRWLSTASDRFGSFSKSSLAPSPRRSQLALLFT